MITAEDLNLPGIAHGFFTREGGFSQGMFATLNAGLGSGDDLATVRKNRGLVADKLGVHHDHLVSAYQMHGKDVAVITGPMAERPKVDGLVSKTPGVALGVLTADCGPILFADIRSGVIGACHAGWKGAVAGISDKTVEAMEALGAKREDITAVLGPTISQANYEVGPEFPNMFLSHRLTNQRYFISSKKKNHYMFDLPQYLIDRLADFGIGTVVNLRLCTYAEPELFYSYRRATHAGETSYGRLISAIALQG